MNISDVPTNENEYCQWFIDSPDQFPEELCQTGGNKTLVWASELRIKRGGRHSGDGRADLMLVDEEGMVWLIEAKYRNKSELNHGIWTRQIQPYRDKIIKMDWPAIHAYTDRFILREGKCIPTEPFASNDCKNLLSAIEYWINKHNIKSRNAQEIIDRMAHHLHHGTFGCAVLADLSIPNGLKKGGESFEHSGPVAYIRGTPNAESGEIEMDVQWSKNIKNKAICPPNIIQQKELTYQKYRKYADQVCNRYTLADGLCEEVKPLWKTLLNRFNRWGWDGRDARDQNLRCITISFPIADEWVELLQIGWPVTDSRHMDPRYQHVGTAGLRLDVYFTPLKESAPWYRDFVHKWAAEFYRLGWRGRGQAINIGERPLTDPELKTWQKQMKYFPAENNEDFTGRPGEKEILDRFCTSLKDMIDDLEIIMTKELRQPLTDN